MNILPYEFIKEKYYKGTNSILYFPNVTTSNLKICPKVKIPYYGLRANIIFFDYFPLPCWEEF